MPFSVRFVAAVALFSVVIGVANWLLWSQSSIWVTVIVALASGVGFAALTSYLGRVTQTALVEAVSGLDKTERSQAIDAVNRGIMPADPTVRSSAILLGTAYLGHKSADQLKRQERQTWILLAFLVPLTIVSAVTSSAKYGGLYYAVLLLLLVIALPFRVLATRRIQRNVAALSDDQKPR